MNHRLAISRAVRASARAGPSRWSPVARCYATTNEDKLTPNLKYTEITHPDCLALQSVIDFIDSQTPYLLNTYSRPNILFTHGKGSTLYAAKKGWTHPLQSASSSAANVEEQEFTPYLDFTAGIAVNALGHADPAITSILTDQSSKIMHLSNVYWNEWAGELARSLIEKTRESGGLGLIPGEPGRAGGKVFLANSGTEANEGALKFARKHGKEIAAQRNVADKSTLVCFSNAFHGRSMGALSVTPNPKYQDPFAPLIPNVRVGEFNAIDSVAELIDESVCGVILEPIQGEGGIGEADVAWLEAVGRRCREVGAVLIYDEIQCGLFRTGKMWAHSGYPADAQPDIVTMAKPLANGFPIGAIMVRDSVANVMTVGSHGTTFGGQVMATRLAHHVLHRLSEPTFLSHLTTTADHLSTLLDRLPKLFPSLISGPIRGRGFIRGIPFDIATSPDAPGEVVRRARERGLLLLTAGSDAVRLIPSLIVTKEECDFASAVIESVLAGMVQDGWGESGKRA